ncbi:hypothetical protein FM996_06190 [Methylosinus sporium]|uniref:Uncharacterized protein n=2 Tax=Methylocystaceae TaxID=31993 RepID=A0A549T2J8_METSR|nr:hypothetical protein FM996_06190 [Methylosinus sporium]
MNDNQLARRLRSVGMACFVQYFELFSDKSISNAAAAAIIVAKESYAETATNTRVSLARRIIREGRARDALRMIAGATNVDPEAASRARSLVSTIIAN